MIVITLRPPAFWITVVRRFELIFEQKKKKKNWRKDPTVV